VIAVKLCLTSLDLLALLKELEYALISSRIENIYQLEDGTFLFRLHSKAGQENFVIEPGRRLNLTRFKHSVPEKPTSQAAQLRHYLSSAKVASIGQVDFDRILYMDVVRGDQRLRVYLEIFGDGNIVVTDESGIIKYALTNKDMKDRTIKPGRVYLPPPHRGKEMAEAVALEEIRDQKFNVARALTRIYNLPPEVVEEALLRASINPDSPSEGFTAGTLAAFLSSTLSMVEEVRAGYLKPNIVMSGGRGTSVLPVEFHLQGNSRKSLPTFNEAVDEYFSSLSAESLASKRKSPAEGELKNLEAILVRQISHIKELEDAQIQENETGRLVMANLRSIQSAIETVMHSRRAGKDWEFIERSVLCLGVKKIDASKGILTITLGDKEVKIDFKLSAADNAERYFTASKEAAKKLLGLKEAVKDTEEKVEKVKQGLSTVIAPLIIKAMKKEWYERFRWTFSKEGFLIIGGKDSTQNEVLVKKHMDPSDIFVHSDVPGGSVVLIKSGGSEVPEGTKYQAVSFAVSYSRAWKAGLAAADGYWVKADQVTKTPPSGEYLGKGAFMIYGERNYLKNVPLALNLGIKFSEDAFKIVVSVGADVEGAIASVKLTTGDYEGPDLVKRIKEVLTQKSGDKYTRLIRAVPDSEISAYLPQGGCAVDQLP
jgi:predicted ribosome quality control (RQC) complex YloA/Tae2 family protein